jgi:hypothetical protein
MCTTSTAVLQRRRLNTGGQMAASLLTPHDNTAAPAWDGFVRKGTRLKSFLDDALQHVATGYAVTNAAGSKRLRLAETAKEEGDVPMQDSSNSNSNNNNHSHWGEREQVASSVAKEKTSEVLLLKQVRTEQSKANPRIRIAF